MTTSTKSIKIACIAAFMMAGLMMISAFTTSIIVLPFSVIPLMAGIGIMRRRVWSAYGLALFEFTGLLGLAYVVTRSPEVNERLPQIVVGAVIGALLLAVFFFAGRSLATAGSKRGWAWPWIALSLLFTVLILMAQAFVIPTGSMENTLLIGDRILVKRFPRANPQFGDMIVFLYPVDRREAQVKRVIGVPGDRIRISDKTVYRNGIPIQESYAVHKTTYADSYRDNFPSNPDVKIETKALEMLRNHAAHGEVIVPERNYFVLGDNRDYSWDSRYWGFVSADDVLGKPFLIYESEDRSLQEQSSQKPAWLHGFRWNRFFKAL